MDNIKINPVKATCMKYGDKYDGIQGLNDTCFSICGAFSGTTNVYDMDPLCTKSCEDLIEKRKKEIYGVGSCDHQVPYKPVIWDQTPNYFPSLIKKGVEPSTALSVCKKLCNEKVPLLSEECQDKCQLHFNSVEMVEVPDLPEVKNSVMVAHKTEQEKKDEKENNFLYLSISIVIIFFLGFIILKK
jgi:hypothetical protein